MRLIIEPDYDSLSKWAANYVAAQINKANPSRSEEHTSELQSP
jgi:glucosamine-6-phosphate deaminase